MTCWHHGRSLTFTSSSGQSEHKRVTERFTELPQPAIDEKKKKRRLFMALLLDKPRRVALDLRGRWRYYKCFIKSIRAWGMSFQEHTFARTKMLAVRSAWQRLAGWIVASACLWRSESAPNERFLRWKCVAPALVDSRRATPHSLVFIRGKRWVFAALLLV